MFFTKVKRTCFWCFLFAD